MPSIHSICFKIYDRLSCASARESCIMKKRILPLCRRAHLPNCRQAEAFYRTALNSFHRNYFTKKPYPICNVWYLVRPKITVSTWVRKAQKVHDRTYGDEEARHQERVQARSSRVSFRQRLQKNVLYLIAIENKNYGVIDLMEIFISEHCLWTFYKIWNFIK